MSRAYLSTVRTSPALNAAAAQECGHHHRQHGTLCLCLSLRVIAGGAKRSGTGEIAAPAPGRLARLLVRGYGHCYNRVTANDRCLTSRETVQKELLQSIPYFAGLDSTELDSLRHDMFERSVPRGEIIQLEGEPAGALFFLASGAVKIFKTSPDGKEQILSIARPGESFNDVAVFDDGPAHASAQAMTPAVLYGIPADRLKTVLREHPQVALNTARVLADRTRQLVELVEDLSFRRVIGRVAKILLDHVGDGSQPRPRLTQQDMAAMAGTVREVVARSLKTLEDEGAIQIDRHQIRITDREALQEMVAAPA